MAGKTRSFILRAFVARVHLTQFSPFLSPRVYDDAGNVIETHDELHGD